MKNNQPPRWDDEVDVIAVGSGGGGLCAAITAHDHGATALVLERSSQVGGVTAYSMGEIWIPGNHLAQAAGIEDSVESGFRYVKSLSMDLGVDAAMLNQAVHGPVALKYFEDAAGLKMRVIEGCPDYYYPHSNDSLAEGRYLEVEPFPATELGEWREKTRLSPHVPAALTHEDIFHNGGTANMLSWDYSVMAARMEKDERCLGPGLAAYFVKGVLDRGIPIRTGCHVEELVSDGDRVIGVRAVQDGAEVFIKANRGVVLAVSSFERNPDYARTLSRHINLESMVMPTVDGAHLRMAGAVGARVAQVPDVTGLALHIPGEETDDGVPLWRGAIPFMGLPHTIVVNRAGRRFADEAFYRSVYFATDTIEGASQDYPNFPCWIVIDSQAREKYPLGSIMPGQELPEGFGVQADTLEALAAATEIDGAQLMQTVASFNRYSETGVDPEFKRGQYPWSVTMTGDPKQKPHPNFGPLIKPPFYAVELRRLGGGGITSTGIVGDEHCRAMGWDNKPVEGLYVAGNSMARLDNGALMQSGMTNARGMTHGYLAGRHVAGQPSDLLEKAIGRLDLEPGRTP